MRHTHIICRMSVHVSIYVRRCTCVDVHFSLLHVQGAILGDSVAVLPLVHAFNVVCVTLDEGACCYDLR